MHEQTSRVTWRHGRYGSVGHDGHDERREEGDDVDEGDREEHQRRFVPTRHHVTRSRQRGVVRVAHAPHAVYPEQHHDVAAENERDRKYEDEDELVQVHVQRGVRSEVRTERRAHLVHLPHHEKPKYLKEAKRNNNNNNNNNNDNDNDNKII